MYRCVIQTGETSDSRKTLEELVEYDDDQKGGPAVATGSSERDTDHDRVEQDTGFQDQDLPLLVRSGQVGMMVVSELEELRVDTRGLTGRSRRLFSLVPRAARADGTVGVMLGHVSVTEKVEQEGKEGRSEGDGGRGSLV